jgi:hypothetical protein
MENKMEVREHKLETLPSGMCLGHQYWYINQKNRPYTPYNKEMIQIWAGVRLRSALMFKIML